MSEEANELEAVQAVLGLVLRTIDRPIFIPNDTIERGFDDDEGFYVDAKEDGIEVGLRKF